MLLVLRKIKKSKKANFRHYSAEFTQFRLKFWLWKVGFKIKEQQVFKWPRCGNSQLIILYFISL